MAIYHLSVKTISRSTGRSATAAAAYRAGVKIADERTGDVHDYTRKGGVGSAELVLPEGAPEWASDRAALWNAAEKAEKRKNSTVAREFEVALPSELSPAERRALAVRFAQELAERYGCAVDVAIHAPGKEGDNRNHHAHILCTTRSLTPEGFGAKTRELDDRKSGAVKEWRERWADLTNAALERAGVTERIDHRSNAERGIEAEPSQHLGPAATGIERRTGEPSRKREEFAQGVTERLEQAKKAGELERQGQAVSGLISDLSGDLAAALNEREQQKRREEDLRQRIEAGRAAQANQVKPVNPLDLLDDRALMAEFGQLARMGAPAELAEKRPDVLAARKLAADTAAAEQAAKEAASKALAAAKAWEEKHYLRAILKVGNEAERLRQEHASQTAAAEKLGRERQRAAHAADTLAKKTMAEIAAVQAEPRARLETLRQEKDRREAVRAAQIQAIQKHLSARTAGMQTFEVQYARTLKGVVVLDTPEHVVVQVSRATTFAHPRKSFGGNPPKVGQSVQIRHDETGNATWTPAKLDLGQVLGLGGGGRGR